MDLAPLQRILPPGRSPLPPILKLLITTQCNQMPSIPYCCSFQPILVLLSDFIPHAPMHWMKNQGGRILVGSELFLVLEGGIIF